MTWYEERNYIQNGSPMTYKLALILLLAIAIGLLLIITYLNIQGLRGIAIGLGVMAAYIIGRLQLDD